MSAATIESPPQSSMETRRWLSVESASNYSTLSVPTLRRMLSDGRLRRHKPSGGRVLIDREQLDRVILAASAAT